jgi:hypothetical protein
MSGPERAPGGRRWRSRPILITAVALAVALALALVISNEIGNGGGVTASASTLPSGVPRYYVALRQLSKNSGWPDGLLAGDAATGQTLATLAPPAGTSFESVSAAADDRTFVVQDVTDPGNPGPGQTDTWYEVRLAPGTGTPAQLTQLPVTPAHGVAATALSASGGELAVATVDKVLGHRSLTVYSVASGRVLDEWSASDRTVFSDTAAYTGPVPALTWVDGDHAIAFSMVGQAAASVRVIDVTGARTGDLLAHSTAIWSARKDGTGTGQLPCGFRLPLVSANGRTVTCAAYSGEGLPTGAGKSPWTLTWLTYPAAAGQPGTGRPAVAYQLAGRSTKYGPVLYDALWANPSGSAVIGAWALIAKPGSASTAPSTPAPSTQAPSTSPPSAPASHAPSAPLPEPTITLRIVLYTGPIQIGVLSQGRFTALRVSPDVLSFPPEIAW